MKMIKQVKKNNKKEKRSINISLQRLRAVNFENFVMELSPLCN